MLIKFSKKDVGKKLMHDGLYLTESADNIHMTSSGKGYSMFVSELSKIKVVDGEGKEQTITGKELMLKLFPAK